MKFIKKLLLATLTVGLTAATFVGCIDDGVDGKNGKDGQAGKDGKDGKDGQAGRDANYVDLSNPLKASKTPSFLKLDPAFSKVKITPILTSEDTIPSSPDFIYGSMADGAGLLKNTDGTFTLINNIEADYSIARITLNKDLQPVKGEHILNANATAFTAQCSGSLITPEEHGFGPLYLSGGEWGGASQGVFVTNPYRRADDASFGKMVTAMGEWVTENAVVIGKDAYPNHTVAFIGDDQGHDETPSGQLGMYVGKRGDLYNGKLYGLKVTTAGITNEVDMKEGKTYDVEFVELEERKKDLLDAECHKKGVMGFSRVEDIDWRRGTAKNNREVYFCVTGRKKAGLKGKGTIYGRVYKVELNDTKDSKGNYDPTKPAKITCVLDGDLETGKAKEFHSPDNIVVTENYAYIQEDPNGYFGTANKNHYARVYQYNLNSGVLKTVVECDQVTAMEKGYGSKKSGHFNDIKSWEFTGMIDVSDVTGKSGTFMLITQNHGWEPKTGAFTDPKANPASSTRKEGSMLFLIEGLDR